MPQASSAPQKHSQGIRSGAVRAIVVTGAVIACTLTAIPALPFLTSARGVAGPTVMDAQSPLTAALAVAAVLIVCTVIACIVGRLLNAAVGLFALGCGVALLSMRTGSVMDAAFDADSLRTIAFETLAWSAAVLAMSAIVFRVSGPLPDMPAIDSKGPFAREIFNSESARALVTGLLAAGVVWLLMRNDLKGQAIGSAIFAGVAAAIAGRKLQGAAQPILLMAAPILGIGIAQLWSAITAGSAAPLDQLVVGHALPGWSKLMPMDVAAGALIGVPVGLGWSRTATDE